MWREGTSRPSPLDWTHTSQANSFLSPCRTWWRRICLWLTKSHGESCARYDAVYLSRVQSLFTSSLSSCVFALLLDWRMSLSLAAEMWHEFPSISIQSKTTLQMMSSAIQYAAKHTQVLWTCLHPCCHTQRCLASRRLIARGSSASLLACLKARQSPTSLSSWIAWQSSSLKT